MNKLVHLEDVLEVVRKCSVKEVTPAYMLIDKAEVMAELMMLQPIQPDNDRLERCRFEYLNACKTVERCRFEYLNACKTVTFPTPDARKNDIYDAYAVMKALYPIFGDEEF